MLGDDYGEPTYVIIGPDDDLGTYRLYRSPPATSSGGFNSCLYPIGYCSSYNPGFSSLQVAEEVVPNPLDGFHGPTSANPERRLTLQGGTRLP